MDPIARGVAKAGDICPVLAQLETSSIIFCFGYGGLGGYIYNARSERYLEALDSPDHLSKRLHELTGSKTNLGLYLLLPLDNLESQIEILSMNGITVGGGFKMLANI